MRDRGSGSTPGPTRPGRQIALALTLGALAGVVEIFTARLLAAGGEVLRINPWFPLLTVAGNLVWFGVLGVALPGRRRLSAAVLIALFVASALAARPLRIHPVAMLVLSLGVGWRFAHIQGRWRVAGWVCVSALVLGTGLSLALDRREVPTRGEKRTGPNILLIVLDTVRAKSLSLYGYERQTTPTLDSLASRSLVFDRAIAPAPWTLPSHASIFTGKYPTELPVGYTSSLTADFTTIAEVLAAHGYATGGFVANKSYAGRWTGLAQGFMAFEDYPINLGEVALATSIGRMLTRTDYLRNRIGPHNNLSRKTASDVVDEFLAWRRGTEPPYFGFLNLMDAHEPYVPPGDSPRFGDGFHLPLEVQSRLTAPEWPHHPKKRDMPPELQASMIDNYDSSIRDVDDVLKELLRRLRDLKDLDNTLVIVTADHGESFGERGVWGHGTSLYPTEMHVPLVLFGPGIEAGRTAETVSLVDLPATIVQEAEIAYEFPGSSLLARARSPARMSHVNFAPPGGGYPIHLGPIMQGLVTDSTYWIRNGDGSEELLDVRGSRYEAREVPLAREPASTRMEGPSGDGGSPGAG